MNVYVWERLDNVTTHYHSEAGIVAVAHTPERAAELVLSKRKESEDKWDKVPEEFALPTADAVVPAGDDAQEAVWIFPDSGCC